MTTIGTRGGTRDGGLLLAVNLKMYFDHHSTVQWCARLRAALLDRPASDAVQIAVLPDFVSMPAVADTLAGTGVRWGAQDLCCEDGGAFTGEVSGATLRQVGCTYVAVGHAERRRLFHEDLDLFAAKTAAAQRNGLTPIICVGEPSPMSSSDAARTCAQELNSICRPIITGPDPTPVVVAYEPVWAIGADRPAPTDHIARVCAHLHRWLAGDEHLSGSRVIYGGSAGPGIIGDLHRDVDGLFLGRFAHDIDALMATVDEADRAGRPG